MLDLSSNRLRVLDCSYTKIAASDYARKLRLLPKLEVLRMESCKVNDAVAC